MSTLHEVREVYNGCHGQLLAQAVLGEGNLLNQIERIRFMPTPSLGQGNIEWIASRLCDEKSELLQRIPRIEETDLLECHGKRIPICIEPKFFDAQMPRTASKALLDFESFSPIRPVLIDIFADSVFTPGNQRFRTSTIDGRIVVEGDDARSYRALFMMTHEIGHCLYERGCVYLKTHDECSSEMFAHLLEAEILIPFLDKFNPDWGGELKKYLMRIDALNLAYFGIEYGVPSPWSQSLRNWVAPELDAFRESLFVTPGYQYHYAAASLRRLDSALGVGGRSWKWTA